MKRVITFGVFDYFHIGHLNLLEQAKELGDILIVALQEDEYIQKYKPDTEVYYSISERIRIIQALRIVDEVITYKDVDIDIQTFDFDILAIGEDQNHAGFLRAIQWCKHHNKEVVRLHYTQGVSSSIIKKKVEKLQ